MGDRSAAALTCPSSPMDGKELSADGNPTWSTILKVTNALGLRFELHTVAS